MSGALVRSQSALPSVERARAILAETCSTHEVKKIRAIAQAVATLERGKQIAIDAGEIVLLADARIGELRRMQTDDGRRNVSSRNITKAVFDRDTGLSRKQAKESERIADLAASGGLDGYVTACRKTNQAPTTSGAVTLARLEPREQKKAIAKLQDVPDVRRAIGEVKLAQKRDLAETIRANPIVTPDGRYQVIAIDPPWKYETRAEDTTHRGRNLYPDMTVEGICALPVAKLAQKDCVLWLWTTNAFMRDAFKCLDTWGFAEKTILTWDKEKIGLGDWLRNVTEHCILAVRGRPVVSLTNQTTLLRAPRREHSRKPDEFYALVEKLCPGSKLEMFAREPRKTWTAWGAEKTKFA